MAKKSMPIVLCMVSGALLWVSCLKDPMPVSVNAQEEYGTRIGGFTAKYSKEQNRVLLGWDEPVNKDEISFYRIYRSTWSEVEEQDGIASLKPDTSESTFVSDGPRRHIDANRTSFTDLLGLASGTYWYSIVPVMINGPDTAEGRMSDIVSAQVSSGVLFSINNGSVYAETDQAKLIVVDLDKTIKSIEFTQKFAPMLVKGETRMPFSWNDPRNPPSETEIKEAIDAGFISNRGKLEDGVERLRVPDFDAPDPKNPSNGPFDMQGATKFEHDWVLEKGNGKKRVWVRIVYEGGTTEIKQDNISIEPWGNSNFIRLALSNQSTGANRTMYTENNVHYLYRPWVRFNVSIFADETVEEEFYYWLAFPDRIGTLQNDEVTLSRNWMETKPRKGRLTGIGSAHDDYHEYTYMLDLDSLKSGESIVFDSVRVTTSRIGNDLAFQLMGEEDLNEYAVPGSYWGESPVDFSSGKLVPVQHRLGLDGAREMLDTLFYLGEGKPGEVEALETTGKKEFYLFAVFKGKHFHDTRTAVLYGETFDYEESNPKRAFFDLVPPEATPPVDDEYFFNNDAVLGKSFSLHLDNVKDEGLAKITDVELLIAQQPATEPWTSNTPYELTPDDLRSYNWNDAFPFEVIVQKSTIDDVLWDDINTTAWPSGDYIMGIVTTDEYGNSGFAPMKPSKGTNPWRVTIQTGL